MEDSPGRNPKKAHTEERKEPYVVLDRTEQKKEATRRESSHNECEKKGERHKRGANGERPKTLYKKAPTKALRSERDPQSDKKTKTTKVKI